MKYFYQITATLSLALAATVNSWFMVVAALSLSLIAFEKLLEEYRLSRVSKDELSKIDAKVLEQDKSFALALKQLDERLKDTESSVSFLTNNRF